MLFKICANIRGVETHTHLITFITITIIMGLTCSASARLLHRLSMTAKGRVLPSRGRCCWSTPEETADWVNWEHLSSVFTIYQFKERLPETAEWKYTSLGYLITS